MYSPPSLLTLIYVIVATSVVVIIDRLGDVEKVVADIGDRLSGSKLLSEDRRSTLMEFAPYSSVTKKKYYVTPVCSFFLLQLLSCFDEIFGVLIAVSCR